MQLMQLFASFYESNYFCRYNILHYHYNYSDKNTWLLVNRGIDSTVIDDLRSLSQSS